MTPANEQGRDEVVALAQTVHVVIGESAELQFADHHHTEDGTIRVTLKISG